MCNIGISIRGLALGMLVVAGGVLPASAETPRTVPYQGLLQLGSQPVNGTKSIVFRLLKDDTTEVWSEQQSVELTEGRFSVLLGSTSASSVANLTNVLRKGDSLYLRLRIVDGTPVDLEGSQKLAPVAYAVQPVLGQVPIGSVIDWWRPNANFPIPEGYQIADGAVVSDTQSPLYGTTLPNLVGRFIRGAANAGEIGLGDGNPTHAHSYDLPAHQHLFDINHDHLSAAVFSGAVGDHKHLWAYQTSGMWVDGTNTRINGTGGDDIDGAGAGFLPLGRHYSEGDFYAYTSDAGSHSHTVAIDLPPYNVTKNTSWVDQDSTPTTAAAVLPPYVNLLKLVRIK